MIDASDTLERDGWTARIVYDADPGSPAEWDNVGILAYETRDASVNPDDLPADPYGDGRFTDECDRCEGTGKIDVRTANGTKHERWACPGGCKGTGRLDGEAIARRDRDAIVCLPVRAWDDRNGTELRIADDWDDANGWIYATAETSGACIGEDASREQIVAALKAELETWQAWEQGDVYGYVVEGPGGQYESCRGFYGLEEVEAEARNVLDAMIDDEREQAKAADRMMRL